MSDFEFIVPMIRKSLEDVENRLGDDLGPDSGVEIAEELFAQAMSYLAASCDIDPEKQPTRMQLARLLAYVVDGVRGTVGTLQREEVELRLEVLRGGRRLVRVDTHTLRPSTNAREVN